jgi:hypothetical protein
MSHWPVGIFRRAYIKTYAGAIGFDPDAAVREIQALYPEPVEPVEPPAPPTSRLRSLVQSAFRSSSRPAPAPPASPRPSIGVATTGYIDAVVEPAPAAPVPAPAAPAPRASRPAPPAPDILAAARLCTELGRVGDGSEVQPLLREAARLLDARGLIVWLWDAAAEELQPALVTGYPAKVRAQLRGVARDADNLTAAAFRASQTFAVGGSAGASGALAVPILSVGACAGVLALEVPDGHEQAPGVCAVAMFVAAMLAQLFGAPRFAEAERTVGSDAIV